MPEPLKIYIDRQKIRKNEPAIVVEYPTSGDKVFCSEVRGEEFVIKQDFTRTVKPVVWIEFSGQTLTMFNTKP